MIINIEVAKTEDEILDDNSQGREPFESMLVSRINLVESMIRYDDSKNLELDSSRVMVSFQSHWYFSVEVNDIMNDGEVPAFKSTKNFILGTFWLLTCLVWGAMTGPLILSLPAADPYVASTWRSQWAFVFILPILIYVYYTTEGMDLYEDILSPYKLGRNLVTTIFNLTAMMGLVLGWSMTVVSHAQVLSSSNGVYILIISIIACKIVHKFEIYGYILFGLGVFVMLTDPLAKKQGGEGNPALGNTLAFVSAGFGAIAGLMTLKNTQIFHPIVYLTVMFLFYALLQMAVFPFLYDNPLFFSFDSKFGVFGWMTNFPAFIYLEAIIVPATSILDSFAFLKSFEYWSLEIISIVLLTRPFITQFIAVMLGQDNIPGVQTILGLVIICFGLLLAFYGAKEKTTNVLKQILSESKFMDETEMKKI